MQLDFAMIESLAPVVIVVSAIGTGGWLFNNWLRMRHGYPLEKEDSMRDEVIDVWDAR